MSTVRAGWSRSCAASMARRPRGERSAWICAPPPQQGGQVPSTDHERLVVAPMSKTGLTVPGVPGSLRAVGSVHVRPPFHQRGRSGEGVAATVTRLVAQRMCALGASVGCRHASLCVCSGRYETPTNGVRREALLSRGSLPNALTNAWHRCGASCERGACAGGWRG